MGAGSVRLHSPRTTMPCQPTTNLARPAPAARLSTSCAGRACRRLAPQEGRRAAAVDLVVLRQTTAPGLLAGWRAQRQNGGEEVLVDGCGGCLDRGPKVP